MKLRYLALVGMLALAGCPSGSTPGSGPVISQSAKTTLVDVLTDACNAYAASLNVATLALQNNLLSESDIATVSQAKVKGDAICKGPIPTDYVAAITNVLSVTGVLTQTAGGK